MKNITLLVTLMTLSAPAFASNSNECIETCGTVEQDVNTPVPKGLEGATIIVRAKDGTETTMDINKFKVVKRKQQFKITERVTSKVVTVEVEKIVKVEKPSRKNIIGLGVRHDFVEVDSNVSGNVVKLYSNKALVFDLNYYRRELLTERIGLGIGLDTNATIRGMLGYEF